MKATVRRFLIREIHGQVSEIINARQEISRSNGKMDYGVDWKFQEVDKKEIINRLQKGDCVACIETLSGKYKEIKLKDIGTFKNF